MRRLAEKGVQAITSARITRFHDDGIDYEQDGEAKSARGFDNVVLAMGMRADNPLETAARAITDEVYVVGDARHAGPANKATEEGPGGRARHLAARGAEAVRRVGAPPWAR